MKVLGILGSPRIGGNADLLLDEVLKGAKAKGAATEKICLGDLEFKGCIECAGCDKTGVCILVDDMTLIYKKLKSADAVIVASPIFFAGLPSQLKAMIDRCQSEWIARYILNSKSKIQNPKVKRKGAFICVSGHKKDTFFKVAKKTIDVFFKTMDIDFTDELFFGGVQKAGEIKKVAGALKKADRLGKRIVEK